MSVESHVSVANSDPSLFEKVYNGACKGFTEGATKGALVGICALAALKAHSTSFYYVEQYWRASGGEPKWPVLEGDCETDQFRNHCIQFPTDSASITVCALVGATTLCGILIGVIKHVGDAALKKLATIFLLVSHASSGIC